MIPVFIVARMESMRLPHKHLLPLGPRRMFEHVIRRCEHFGFNPLLCVPKGEQKCFEDFCEVFGGHPYNVEARCIEAAHEYEHTTFHVIDADDPYFDEWEVIDSYNAVLSGLARVRPSYRSLTGSGRVGTSFNLKGTGERNLSDRGMNYPWPQRLTLDYPEDYVLLQAVYCMCGGYMTPRQVVDDAFRVNPDLHKINWHLTERWKEHQHAHKNQDIPAISAAKPLGSARY